MSLQDEHIDRNDWSAITVTIDQTTSGCKFF